MKTMTRSRPVRLVLAAILALALIASLLTMRGNYQQAEFLKTIKGKAPTRKGEVQEAVINASPIRPVTVPNAPVGAFTPQTRLGFDVGDQWEPAIASDRFGHVYVLYPQYEGVPGCANCSNPTMIMQVSNDRGATWGSPFVLYPAGAMTGGQWDPQVSVDPVDGSTVYVSFMQNNKSDILVGKSTNFGSTWNFVTADATNSGTDKPIMAVRGQDVYVVYTHAQTTFVAYSHNGGTSFTEKKISKGGGLGWALAGGGTVTPNGDVYFSWAGYEGNGGASGNVNLYVSKSTNGGVSWSNKIIDISASPPQCPEMNCGWAYLGAQAVMTSDANGVLYVLWNSGSTAGGPERIYFSKSTNGGTTWSTKVDVSTAPAGTHHAFPAIVATGNGSIRISWMDARAANGGVDRWNVYYRSTTNGGSTWSSEVDISTFTSGFTYIFNNGFRFPFGDYYEMDLDENGKAHLIFGEGYDYNAPGSIWYVNGP